MGQIKNIKLHIVTDIKAQYLIKIHITMSAELCWSIIRNNSCFLKKSHGLTLTKEPNNLTGINSFKYNGLVNKKTKGLKQNHCAGKSPHHQDHSEYFGCKWLPKRSHKVCCEESMCIDSKSKRSSGEEEQVQKKEALKSIFSLKSSGHCILLVPEKRS